MAPPKNSNNAFSPKSSDLPSFIDPKFHTQPLPPLESQTKPKKSNNDGLSNKSEASNSTNNHTEKEQILSQLLWKIPRVCNVPRLPGKTDEEKLKRTVTTLAGMNAVQDYLRKQSK